MSWLDLEALDRNATGCPRRMLDEWSAQYGRLDCERCRRPIAPGELFFLSGHCAMGGLVPAGAVTAAYADVLEPRGEHVACAARERGAAEFRCHSIGHGTRELEAFLAMLREHEIRLLADIRTVPKSRKNPQYHIDALSRTLPEAGICYLHLPGLGGLRHPRPDSPNTGWRNESFRGYADYMLTPKFDAALEELIALLAVQPVAIMCAETVPWRCHRSLVADALLVRGIPTQHLMEPGKSHPHTLTRFARPEGTRLLYPPEEAGE